MRHTAGPRLPRVFVSYSGRSRDDKELVRNFLYRLNEQALEAWIYERRGSEIPPGSGVLSHCREKIRHSDIFIAVISTNCFQSHFTRAEVEFALGLCRRGVLAIFPLVLGDRPEGPWPEPYDALEGRKSTQIATTGQIEDRVEDVCRLVEIKYNPPRPEDSRMPLQARLEDELSGLTPARADEEVGVYSELRRLGKRCVELYAAGGKREALEVVRAMLVKLRIEFPRVNFYYPVLIQGVLEVELAKYERDLERARSHFQGLVDRGKGEFDENALAGLAYVDLQLGNPRQALRFYLAAAELTHGFDSDLAYNIVLTTIVAGEELTPERFKSLMTRGAPDVLVRDPEEVIRFDMLRAIAALYMGSAEDAGLILSAIDLRDPPLDLLIEYADRLWEAGDHSSNRRLVELAVAWVEIAIEAVERGRPATTPIEQELKCKLLHRLARFHFWLGDLPAASRHFCELIGLYPKSPQFLVEAAQCLLALEDLEDARRLCEQAVQVRRFGLASPASDECSFHYYRGFAHWLLGDQRDAELDFAASERPPEDAYGLVTRSLRLRQLA